MDTQDNYRNVSKQQASDFTKLLDNKDSTIHSEEVIGYSFRSQGFLHINIITEVRKTSVLLINETSTTTPIQVAELPAESALCALYLVIAPPGGHWALRRLVPLESRLS